MIAAGLPGELLARFSEFVAERMGLRFPEGQSSELERGVCLSAEEAGFPDVKSFLHRLLSGDVPRNQLEILASHLTVGETYFYREPQAFEALEKRIVPELVASSGSPGRPLRLWSAACCTGEEPYSLAIALSRAIPNLKDWHITILATDINPRFLEKASRARYGEWSFRGTPQWLKAGYFARGHDGSYAVSGSIRNMVKLSYLNLAEDSFPSLLSNTNAMDVIFCRNVLMYFTPERRRRAILNLHSSLREGGWLIVGVAETSSDLGSQFTAIGCDGLTLYRKDSCRQGDLPAKQFGSRLHAQTEPVRLQSASTGKPSRPSNTRAARTARVPIAPYDEALALYGRGLYAEAVDRLLGSMAGGQADVRMAVLLARACANQGKLVEALEWTEKAISGDRYSSGLYYLRATIQEEEGTTDAAIASLKRALYLDPDMVLAHFALGNLAFRNAEPKQASKHFENALALLKPCPPQTLIPESEGLSAGRLMEIIGSIPCREDTGEEDEPG